MADKIKLPLNFACASFRGALPQNTVEEHPYVENLDEFESLTGFMPIQNRPFILPEATIDEKDLLLAQFRYACRKIPPALLKDRIAQRLEKEKKPIPKAVRTEIKEQCHLQLLREMPFVPADIYVLASESRIRFMNGGKRPIQAFTGLLRCEVESPARFQNFMNEKQAEEWDSLNGAFPTTNPTPAWPGLGSERNAEFLLWLLEERNIDEGVRARVDKSIKLANDVGKSALVCRTSVYRDFSPELAEALRQGYVPVSADVVFEDEEKVWRTVFPTGAEVVKYGLPKEENWGKDFDSDLPLWLENIKKFERYRARTLETFVKTRLGSGWNDIEKNIWKQIRR